MAGMPPQVQGQPQNPNLPNPNPNQPNPNQNPYAPTPNGQQGAGAGYTQPSYVPLGSFNPNQTIQYLNQGFAGTDANAQNQLNQTLADFGINGGQAVDEMGNLQSQLASAQAPTIANAIQNSQQMQLQGGEFNAGSFNQSQAQQLQDLFNQWGQQFGAFNNIIGQGQGAGNQNANQYGSTITQNPGFLQMLMGGLGNAAGAAGGLFGGGFSAPGGGSPLPGYGENTSP
jgi:hypothetical protein